MNSQTRAAMDSEMRVARRCFLQRSAGLSLGALSLGLLEGQSANASSKPAPSSSALNSSTPLGIGNIPHFAPRAKNIIFLTQSGGPSQIELFDYKPNLHKMAGVELPDSVRQGQRVTTMTSGQKQLIMPPQTSFGRYGQSGATLGEWLPYHRNIVDDVCFIKSMVTDQINHAPAMTKLLTGHQLVGRPSMGAWASYGLGSENRNLPDYLVLISKMKRPSDQPLYDYYWGSGFLPSRYQGVQLRAAEDPVLYLQDPKGMPREVRRGMLDGLSELNSMRLAETRDPEIETRIQQYEMAWRMQTSVPELGDLGTEPESTFDLYGPDSRRAGSYAANCILARRMVERGVRFVQLFHPDWDHHNRLTAWCPARCRDTDQASAALVTDLKQRGLLDETLVIWGGEFGRGVAGQGDWQSVQAGRDHHPRCFTIWMAGGGVQPGMTYGATDDFSFNAVENPVHVRDLHATVLDLLGIDHERFTYRFQGLDFKLTGVEESRVVKDVLV